MSFPEDITEKPFEIEHWYGETRYSDVTIKYSGKELQAHKIILCSQCKYFEDALAQHDGTKERGADVVELGDDDDAIAIEVTIKYLYTAELSIEAFERAEIEWWEHMVETAFASVKFGLPSLLHKVCKKLETGGRAPHDDISRFIKLLDRALEIPGDRDGMELVVMKLCDRNFRDIFGDQEFRQWLDGGHEELREILFRRNIAWLVKQDVFRERMKTDPEFAMKCMQQMTELHAADD